MFRVLLLLYGIAIGALVALFFFTRRPRYLSWARRLLLAGLAAGVAFFALLLVKRWI
jgi:hypothetical protein